MLYNWHRDYNPALGRYVQSDPIGLDGGSMSTYAYVHASPLWRSDSRGLADSLTDSIASAVAHGNVEALNQLLLAGLPDAASEAAVQQGIRDATVNAAKQAASALRAQGVDSGVVATDGTETGVSTTAGGPGTATNQSVADAMNAVKNPSAYHGHCGEINLFSKLLNQGEQLAGRSVAAVRVTTGKLVQACSTCQSVANYFGVHIINP